MRPDEVTLEVATDARQGLDSRSQVSPRRTGREGRTSKDKQVGLSVPSYVCQCQMKQSLDTISLYYNSDGIVHTLNSYTLILGTLIVS